jgi:hypothetical protein
MIRLILGACLLLIPAPAPAQNVTAYDRATVIKETAALLEGRYVDAALGKRLAQDIKRSAVRWKHIRSAPDFADALTKWLRDQSGDGHLAMDFSEKPIPEASGDEAISVAETERYYGAHLNHGVQKIERLDGNIMLVDLRVFPPPAMAGDVISAMMTIVAQGDALILDLRKNGGGMETVNLISGYLLPPGSPMSGTYDRPSDRLTLQTSPTSVPGRRFGSDKPVYILTSKRTFSAAEALAYDLQALKRAVIVGEVTGGGANPFEYRRVHRHFALSLPEQRSINPITGTNWQGVGVNPDVEVPAENALSTALDMARKRLATQDH